MARGRSPGYDEQREMILDRAARLFATHGYAGTSMNQVAQACGLSKATLYHYHRDKDQLLVHIAEAHVLRLRALAVVAAHELHVLGQHAATTASACWASSARSSPGWRARSRRCAPSSAARTWPSR